MYLRKLLLIVILISGYIFDSISLRMIGKILVLSLLFLTVVTASYSDYYNLVRNRKPENKIISKRKCRMMDLIQDIVVDGL